MALGTEALKAFTSRLGFRGQFNVETLAATKACTLQSSQFQALDPDGSPRDVTLPAVTKGDDGYFVFVLNTAGAANALTVKDAAAATVATVAQNKAAVVYVTAAGAWARLCVLDAVA